LLERPLDQVLDRQLEPLNRVLKTDLLETIAQSGVEMIPSRPCTKSMIAVMMGLVFSMFVSSQERYDSAGYKYRVFFA
jgi:hypothetical protein